MDVWLCLIYVYDGVYVQKKILESTCWGTVGDKRVNICDWQAELQSVGGKAAFLFWKKKKKKKKGKKKEKKKDT